MSCPHKLDFLGLTYGGWFRSVSLFLHKHNILLTKEVPLHAIVKL